jgi:sporulation protein YunB
MKLLAGIGPKIRITISSIGNVKTDLKSEFSSKGINQTLHRVYLQVDCEVNILTPFNNISKRITNQILIAENVIVGNIPDTYYNLEGLTQDDVMEVMQ